MTAVDISIATPADRERVLASLVPAFAGDPVLRYLFPDDATYPAYAAVFFGHLFDKRVAKGTIWTVGRGASVAMWEPPAPEPATEPVAESVADTGLAGLLPEDALARLHTCDEAVHAAMPAGPYWYLGVLATHPDYHGRRWGHAVMQAGLRRAAEDALPAVLETATTGNVEMYRRAGWEVAGTVTDPLPIWIMRYPPR